ncbi:hypothetical protein D3C81_1227640 [compost metagenome]
MFQPCGKATLTANSEVDQPWAAHLLITTRLPRHQQPGFLVIAEESRVNIGQIQFDLLIDRLGHLHPRQPGRTVTLTTLHEWQPYLLLVPGRRVITERQQGRQALDTVGLLDLKIICGNRLTQGTDNSSQLSCPQLQAQLHQGQLRFRPCMSCQ